MDMNEIRRQNLRVIINLLADGSVAFFARKFGFSEARMSQLLSHTYRDGNNFGEKMARKIEVACDLGPLTLDGIPEELTLENDGRTLGYSLYPSAESIISDLEKAPATIEGPLARIDPKKDGSSGFEIVRQAVAYKPTRIGVRIAWMQEMRLRPDQIAMLQVQDESMEPALYLNDFIVVDVGDNQPNDGKAYAVLYEGNLILRRVVRDAGQWWLTCDHPDQRRFPRKALSEANVTIVGKIVLKQSSVI
jgi:hypothetical protein